MRDELRARIAYVAARLIVDTSAKEIQDHARTVVVHIEGLVSRSTIDVFDFSSSCRLSGEQSEDGFSLFDYDANQYVDLNLDGDDFEGFDYATGTRYTGEVRSRKCGSSTTANSRASSTASKIQIKRRFALSCPHRHGDACRDEQ